MRPVERFRSLPPALITDLPVLVFLVACWMLVAVYWAHVITGVVLVALIGVHLQTRRQQIVRLFRAGRGAPVPRRWARRLGYVLFFVATFLMTATGGMRWAGIPPQHTMHAGAGYLLVILALVHLWSQRRALRGRLRRRAAPSPVRPPEQ